MSVLRRMRRAIQDGRYEITFHATEEMSNDALAIEDVFRVIETGQVSRKLTHDPRGERYEVAGRTEDARRALVVARFLADGTLRVITAYVPRSETL